MTGIGMVADLLSSAEMREALAEPRQVPRAVREYMAEIVLRDIVLGEDYVSRDPARAAGRLGPLFQIFLATRFTEEWAELRQIASASPAIALICAHKALNALFDAFEEAAMRDTGPEISRDRAAFVWLIKDTLALWGRTLGEGNIPAHHLESSGGAEHISDLVQKTYVPRIRPFLDEMAESADAIEFLALLYPCRMWDRGMAELHREHIGNIRLYSDIASRSRELQQILDAIGRSSADEAPGKCAVTPRSRSELHSVVNSKDLQYILPSELVKLQDRTMKYLFLARWTEGKLLTYQLTGKSRSRKGIDRMRGPIVVLVDTSGSMSGSPSVLAKAIVLAAAKRALGAGRDMRVVMFSSAGETRTIDLSGRQKMAAEFLDFLRHTFGGGTDFNTALGSGLEALREERFGSADLLFITDGLSKITDERLLGEWGCLKADLDAQIFTVLIGNDSAGGLERISDRTFVLEAGPGLSGTMKLTSL
ncbi:MAG: VWA domain-containing protein [Methanocella sp.]